MNQDVSMNLGNYLEALVELGGTPDVPVRPVDLATSLGVSKPSVCSAVSTLKRKGLADQPYRGGIMLSEEGYAVGRSISDKHKLAKRFLSEVLLLDEEQVAHESEFIKYAIEDESFARWSDFVSGQGCKA